MKKLKVLLPNLSIVLGLNFCFLQAQSSSWENLVNQLTKTRSEIEVLSQELESVQKEKQSELDQLSMRKADIDAQVEKEKLRKLQINEKLKRLEGRVRIIAKSDPKAQQMLQAWITDFEVFVNKSIPFEREARLKNLEGLKIRLQRNHEPNEYVMADLWNFVENEFKLSKTNEYQIVTLDLRGQKRKCEVARLGLTALFAVTPDGKIHHAKKNKNEWQWTDVQTSAEQDSILSLVKNLKDKNSTQVYQLPINLNSESAVGFSSEDDEAKTSKASKKSIETSMNSNSEKNTLKEGASL